jgi:hypothetical protein
MSTMLVPNCEMRELQEYIFGLGTRRIEKCCLTLFCIGRSDDASLSAPSQVRTDVRSLTPAVPAFRMTWNLRITLILETKLDQKYVVTVQIRVC